MAQVPGARVPEPGRDPWPEPPEPRLPRGLTGSATAALTRRLRAILSRSSEAPLGADGGFSAQSAALISVRATPGRLKVCSSVPEPGDGETGGNGGKRGATCKLLQGGHEPRDPATRRGAVTQRKRDNREEDEKEREDAEPACWGPSDRSVFVERPGPPLEAVCVRASPKHPSSVGDPSGWGRRAGAFRLQKRSI